MHFDTVVLFFALAFYHEIFVQWLLKVIHEYIQITNIYLSGGWFGFVVAVVVVLWTILIFRDCWVRD